VNLWLCDARIPRTGEGHPDDEHDGGARRLLAGGDPLASLEVSFREVTTVAVRSWGDQPAASRLRSQVTAVADDAGLVRSDAQLLEDVAAIAAGHSIFATTRPTSGPRGPSPADS
jgi:hypothetical protein